MSASSVGSTSASSSKHVQAGFLILKGCPYILMQPRVFLNPIPEPKPQRWQLDHYTKFDGVILCSLILAKSTAARRTVSATISGKHHSEGGEKLNENVHACTPIPR